MRPPGEQPPAHRSGAAGDWRSAFIRIPYWRDETTRLGAIFDTFESAITWDRFEAFYNGVRDDVQSAIACMTDHASLLSCRFTHVYPDGPAPYFTFTARGSSSGDIASALARWREIKLACNDAVVRHGGTSTHDHAVGRDHRSAYDVELPALMRGAFAGATAGFDPRGVMNPARCCTLPGASWACAACWHPLRSAEPPPPLFTTETKI